MQRRAGVEETAALAHGSDLGFILANNMAQCKKNKRTKKNNNDETKRINKIKSTYKVSLLDRLNLSEGADEQVEV